MHLKMNRILHFYFNLISLSYIIVKNKNIKLNTIMNFVESIAIKLRAARKDRGFKTAKEFSDKLNIPKNTYRQHESGKRSMNIEVCIKYCSELSIDPAWLIFGDVNDLLYENKVNKKLNTNGQYPTILKNNTCTINMPLYRHILTKAICEFHPENISINQLLDLCENLYNNIAPLSADQDAKNKMIDLAISSLSQNIEIKNNKNIII